MVGLSVKNKLRHAILTAPQIAFTFKFQIGPITAEYKTRLCVQQNTTNIRTPINYFTTQQPINESTQQKYNLNSSYFKEMHK